MAKKNSFSHLTPGQKLSSILFRLLNNPAGIPVDQIKLDYALIDRTFRNYLRDLQQIPELIGDDGEPLIIKEKDGDIYYLKMRAASLGGDKAADFFSAFYMASSLMNFLSGTGIYKPIDKWVNTLKKNNFHIPINHINRKIFSVSEWPKDYSGKDEIVRKVLHAVIDQRKVDIEYKSPYGSEATTHKSFHPYTLMQYRYGLYVIGHSKEAKNSIISLGIDRIRHIDLLREKFQYPAAYSPADFYSGTFGIMKGAQTFQVELQFNKSIAALVKERKHHKSAKYHDLPSGGLKVSMAVNGFDQLVPWILSFGPLVKVIAPKELRDRVISELRQASELYTKENKKR